MPIQNGVMMQYFHWYTPSDGTLWDEAAARATELARAGFTALWLPPAYKGTGGASDVGYGVYDMYDLGEFDQKGSVRTKYGTKKQYLAAVKALQKAGLQVYADTVLNHRMGGDSTETVRATPFPQDDRLRPKGEPREIEAYTHFRFPGRRGRHSKFEWHARHFDAVDYDHRNPGEWNTVYLIEGKHFDDQVALENGNFSYLMGSRPRLREPGGARRGHRLGQVVSRHDGGGRLPPRRGEAHVGLVLPRVARRDGEPREAGPLHRRGVLDGGRRLAPLVPGPPGRPDHRLRGAPPLPLPLREPGRRQLRHAAAPRRHADAAAEPGPGDLRGQPRLAAAAGARVGGRALVQAARLRARPPAPRRLPVRLPRRLLRGGVRGPGPGRERPPAS